MSDLGIALMKKYRPRSLNDIAKLPVSEEEKSLMHNQLKVDMVYFGKYAENKLYGVEGFDMDSLSKQYGPASLSIEEIDTMMGIDQMNKSLLGK